MFKGIATVRKTVDKTSTLNQSLKHLGNMDVYVGIPEGDIGDHDGITNAELMFALTHGVRSKDMRDEMDDYMGLTPGGTPVQRTFQTFLGNMGKMPYSAAYEMFIHAHGSPLWHIPPRPVIEPAIEHNKEFVAKQLRNAAVMALDGQDPTPGMQKAGEMGVTVSKDWFTNPLNMWPANAPSTVKTKGSDMPNIDTKNLMNSITFVVAKKS